MSRAFCHFLPVRGRQRRKVRNGEKRKHTETKKHDALISRLLFTPLGATERTNERAGAATELAATSANDDETPTIACYSPLDGNPKELKLRGS